MIETDRDGYNDTDGEDVDVDGEEFSNELVEDTSPSTMNR
jgi:hypothetical protein